MSFPFDLHNAAVFDSHMRNQLHVSPLTCSVHTVLKATSQGHGTAQQGLAWAQHGMCELTSDVERRPLYDLPKLGFFRLPCGIPRRLSSESQTEMQLGSVKPSNVCHGRGEAVYFGART